MLKPADKTSSLVDGFGRAVNYLRLSVTDRCDLRCTYCMSEKMKFMPKAELLSFEELEYLCTVFIRRGVRHLRITGGEPLVRRDILKLIRALSRFIGSGALKELTLTTNATQLEHVAQELADCGVRRINISLDTLHAEKFATITRRDRLAQVLRGIDAALVAGLRLKLNTVALKQQNVDELPQMIRWAHGHGMDMTIIETMPMGETGHDRFDQYIPLTAVRSSLSDEFTMKESNFRTSGPSRYVDVAETGGRLGFISPLSHNFCENCNRVRITCTGQLYTCLGHDGMRDLKPALRNGCTQEAIDDAIDDALARKPKGHDFDISRRGQAPSVHRHMSVTGG